MLQTSGVESTRIDRTDPQVTKTQVLRAPRPAVWRPRHAQDPICYVPRAAAAAEWHLHREGEDI